MVQNAKNGFKNWKKIVAKTKVSNQSEQLSNSYCNFILWGGFKPSQLPLTVYTTAVHVRPLHALSRTNIELVTGCR